jgi:ankyrin repeat protein
MNENFDKLNEKLENLEKKFKDSLSMDRRNLIIKEFHLKDFFDSDYLLDGKKLEIKIIGSIIVTSGIIIACDPYTVKDYDPEPFNVLFPTGNFPLELVLYDDNVALALIRFSDAKITCWENTDYAGSGDCSEEDETFVYGVDTGIGSFMDYECYKEIRREIQKSGELNCDVAEYGSIVTVGNANAAFFASGYGDGSYGSYIGRDDSGNVACLLTDFLLIGQEEDPDMYLEFIGEKKYEKCVRAIQKRDLKKAAALFEKGLDINYRDLNGYTLLMVASEIGDLDMVKYFVEQGSDINMKSNGNHTALSLAIDNGKIRTIKYLLELGAELHGKFSYGMTNLMMAIYRDDIKTSRYLIEKGAKANDKSDNGFTPLMIAAKNGNFELVKLLVENKAVVNFKNYGWSSLMSAVESGNFEVVKYLVEHGADITSETAEGITAMKIAQEKGFKKIEEYLSTFK